jgi:hypothetical protein
MLDAVEEERPVRQSGQRVVKRLMGQLALERVAFGDVVRRSTMPRTFGSSRRLLSTAANVRTAPFL